MAKLITSTVVIDATGFINAWSVEEIVRAWAGLLVRTIFRKATVIVVQIMMARRRDARAVKAGSFYGASYGPCVSYHAALWHLLSSHIAVAGAKPIGADQSLAAVLGVFTSGGLAVR
jgi:hypothetical protein